MKRAEDAGPAGAPPPHDGAPATVTLRALYADAMQKVMADPRSALAEHDPWLAVLLAREPAATRR